MNIFVIKTPLLDSNMYLIEERDHTIIVDPYWDATVAEYLMNLRNKIDFVYLTHEHYDHISGIEELQKRYHSRIFCSAACAAGISDERKNHTRHFEAFCILQSKKPRKELLQATIKPRKYQADDVFKTQCKCSWQGHKLLFFETPGHSEGSSSLLLDNRLLFCGDSLTRDLNVITRFPGGDERAFQTITLPLFSNLAEDTWVCPGHGTLFPLSELKLFR